MQDENDTIFALDPEFCQHRANSRDRIAQFRVADRSSRIDKGSLVATTFGNVAVDEVDRGIIIALETHYPSCPGDTQASKDGMEAEFLDLSHK